MKWIAFKDAVPDGDIAILLSNGVTGVWIDDLYPNQAYLSCNCECDYSESFEIENLIKKNFKWMKMPLLPKDDK